MILKHISRMLCLLISYSKFTRTFLGFTFPDSLDMIKIENTFTGYRGRAYVQKKASQRNKQRITGIDHGIFSDRLRQQ